jgi:hypothetical protein
MIKFASRQTHSAPRHRRESGFQPTNSYLNGLLLLHTLTRRRHAMSARVGGLVQTTSALLFRVRLTDPWERSRLRRYLKLAPARARGTFARQHPGESDINLSGRFTEERQVEIMVWYYQTDPTPWSLFHHRFS